MVLFKSTWYTIGSIALALSLVLLIIGLWRPDLLRKDAHEIPLPTLSAHASRPANWAEPLNASFRLYVLSDSLYRSALPERGNVDELRRLGISTVINLYQQSDESWLNDAHVRRIHIPIRGDRVKDSDVIAVLRAIRQGERLGAVLVHCKHGQNRTGLIIAMYRIIYDGWKPEQAVAEMLEGGFGSADRMKDAIAYLNRVDLSAFRNAVATGKCSTSFFAGCEWRGLFGGWTEPDDKTG
ncbi:MAG: dual specificity protein phosphatase family protein [Halopseudomonas sp.]|uniref:phosphatase domain-containing protein n=1 Tax=Halopseudomonas sp. TaxID=2901191 RepID=UPI0030035CEB